MKYRSYTNDDLVDMLIEETDQLYIPALIVDMLIEETDQLYIPALINAHITLLDLRELANKLFEEIDPYEVPGALHVIRDLIVEKGSAQKTNE